MDEELSGDAASSMMQGAAAGTMIAPGVGTVIGAGLGLAGGMLSSRSARRQQRMAIDAQREFAQHGIRWKVEDAKAAGLHPLFALGSSTSGPSIPIFEDPIGRAVSDMGQNVSRAVVAQETTDQRLARMAALNTAAAAAEKDYAQAAYYKALEGKTLQEMNAVKPMPEVMTHQQKYEGWRDIQADPQVSRYPGAPHVSASISPMWKTYEIRPGLMMDLPWSQEGPQESLESLKDRLLLPIIIAHNMERHGPEWLNQAASFLNQFIK